MLLQLLLARLAHARPPLLLLQQPWLDSLRLNAKTLGRNFLTAAAVALVFWLVASVGRRLIAYTAPRVKADKSVVLLLSRLYYYGVLAFGVVTALGTAGLDIRALVAGLGLTGFALGFALKDVLSNFVSGAMLLAYRSFRIGDVIEMGEFLGVIEDIRIRDTLIRTEDGRLVIIPNTKLITEVVVNHTDARGPWHDNRAGALGHAQARRRAAPPPEDDAGDEDVRPPAPAPPPTPREAAPERGAGET